MTVKTDADVPGGMALAEQAVHLLRVKGGAALACYYVGCLPFLLGLLYFWSDMSRNPDAGWYCAPAAAGLALLFIWMKVWQVCFCRRLWCALQDTAPESWNWRRWLAVAARQTFYHGTGVVVLLLAAVIMLPLAWTYAFYQNVTIMDSPTTRSVKVLYADASRQALLWPGQNHILLTLMSVFGLLVWMNTGAGLMLLPYLLKWFLGIETAFTISGLHAMTNTTFLAIICALAYAFVDPVVKAAYTLRCFYGRSRQTGDDLRAALKPFIMGVSVGLAILAGAAVFTPVRTVYGDHRIDASMASGQEDFVHRLDKRIDQTLSQRRFAWRLPREKSSAEDRERRGWLWDTLRWLGDKIEAVFEAFDRWLDALSEWLRKHLPQGREGRTQGRDWDAIIRMTFYGIGAGLVILVLMLLRRWIRAYRAQPSDRPTGKPEVAVDLDDENLTADDLPKEQWLVLARELIARQEPRQALRAYYLAILAQLGHHGRLVIARYKSNRDYLTELLRRAHAEPELAELFDRCVSVFERAWYGMYPVTEDQLSDFVAKQERIATLVQPTPSA